MRFRKLVTLFILVLLIVSVLNTFFISEEGGSDVIEQDNSKLMYEDHGPIRIDSDSDFADQATSDGWEGSGTEGDPWMIEGYDIDGSGDGYCLFIGNTSSHFMIKDCYFHDSEGDDRPFWRDSGIYLHNVSNGISENNTVESNEGDGISIDSADTCIIRNSTVKDCRDGIYVTGANTDLTIEGCESYSNIEGIALEECTGTVIDNCYIHDNNKTSGSGVEIGDHCSQNRIENCTISNNYEAGIWIDDWETRDNTLVNNIITVDEETGIHFGGYDALRNDIRTSNTVNGEKVYVIGYENNMTIEDISITPSSKISVTNYGLITLHGCDNVTVSNCTTSRSDNSGIFVSGHNTNLLIKDCESFNNSEGMVLKDCTGANVDNCHLHDNLGYYGSGIEIEDHCSENRIENCTISSNHEDGIRIDDWETYDNVLVNNDISVDEEIGINFGGYSALNNEIRSSNMVNGAPIYLVSDEIDEELKDRSSIPSSKISATNFGLFILYNCDNVTVSNCTAANSENGGFWVGGDNSYLTIKDCESYNNTDGIVMEYCTGAEIDNCYLHDNTGYYGSGIDIKDHCSQNRIEKCTINNNQEEGIRIDDWETRDNTFVNNSITIDDETGIYFGGYDALNNDIGYSNTVNGTPILMLSNEDNVTLEGRSAVHTSKITATNYGSIIINDCDNVTVSNCTAANSENSGFWVSGDNTNLMIKDCESYSNYEGLRLIKCSGVEIIDCYIHHNTGLFSKGINIKDHCSQNLIKGCTITDNDDEGIYIDSWETDNNTVRGCTIRNNTQGLYIDGRGNLVYDNFFNNTVNALAASENSWNITKKEGTNIVGGPYLGGNYWSDYTGVDMDGDQLGDTLLPYNSSGKIEMGGDWSPLTVKNKTDVYPPKISHVGVVPDSTHPGGWVNISCRVKDNVDVSIVEVIITGPEESSHPMIHIEGVDLYYYNSTYELRGNYSYHIKTVDVNGNIAVSSMKMFTVGLFISDLRPTQGTELSSGEVIITWETNGVSTSEVYLKEADSSSYSVYHGAEGKQHVVNLEGLSEGGYGFYVKSEGFSGTARSEVRSFTVKSGISFSDKSYNFTIERDYDQVRYIRVKNHDSVPHRLQVTLENPYDDFLAGFIGNGSEYKMISLEEGGTENVALSMHAQHAYREDYRLRLNVTSLATNLSDEKSYDYAIANIHIQDFDVDLSFTETDTDPYTLAKTFVIENHGDNLTDLRVWPGPDLKGKVTFEPMVDHTALYHSEMIEFEVAPVLTTDFTGLNGTLYAGAYKTELNRSVNFTLPEGYEVFLGDADYTSSSSSSSTHCTNEGSWNDPCPLPPGADDPNPPPDPPPPIDGDPRLQQFHNEMANRVSDLGPKDLKIQPPQAICGVRGSALRPDVAQHLPDIRDDNLLHAPFYYTDNTFHVVWQTTPGESTDTYYLQMHPGEDIQIVHNLSHSNVDSRWPMISGHDGNLYSVWVENETGDSDVYFARSTNNGLEWSSPMSITQVSPGVDDPILKVDSSGVIHVVWEDFRNGEGEIYYTKSVDHGSSWSSVQRLTNSSGDSEYPFMVVDSYDNIHLVWEDHRNGVGQIYYLKSTDNGDSWSSEQVISPAGSDSGEPSMTFTQDDTVHVVWRDSRHEESEIYYRKSTDAGGTWESELRLSRDSYYSEYPLIMAGMEDTLRVLWHDNRTGDDLLYYRDGNEWLEMRRLPRGYLNVEKMYLEINFTLTGPYEEYPVHDLKITVEGHTIVVMNSTVLNGTYLFEIDPEYLNYSKTTVDIGIKVEGLSQGDYLVSSDKKLITHLSYVDMPVVALNQTNADSIVKSLDIGEWKGVDPAAYVNDIEASDDKVYEGEEVTINSTIRNLGEDDVSDVEVQFFDGHPMYGGEPIGSKITISSIPSYGHVNVSTSWITERGYHEIYVLLDGNDKIGETVEYNNLASILVTGYSTDPPTGEISIDHGADHTSRPTCSVTFDIESHNPLAFYRISNDNETWTEWMIYSRYVGWRLSEGQGVKTVFGQVRDEAGFTSKVMSDTIILEDTDPPEIKDITTGIPTTGDEFDLEAEVYDAVGVSSVSVEYWFDSGPHSNVSMNMAGENWIYQIDVPEDAGTLYYVYHASDTSGNRRSSIEFSRSVLDDDLPSIHDRSADRATTGDDYVFNASVIDNVDVSEVFVEYWFGSEDQQHQNISMDEIQDGSWIYEIITPSNSDEMLHYTISANDTSGNWASTGVKDVNVIDNDPPTADAGDDITLKVGDSAEFDGSGSEDNIGIESYVWTSDDIPDLELQGSQPDHIFENAGTYEVVLTVKDSAGNEDTDTVMVTVEKEDTDGDDIPDGTDEGDGWLIYIIPVIIAALVIVGLVYWKMQGKKGTEEVPNEEETEEELVSTEEETSKEEDLLDDQSG